MAYKPVISGGVGITDGTIVAADLGAACVTQAKIAAGAVSSSHIGSGQLIAGHFSAGCVGETAIAAGAVSAGKIAANAVTSTELAANAVTNAKIAAGAVSSAKCDSTVARTNGGNTFASGQQTFSTGLSISPSQFLSMNQAYLLMTGNSGIAFGINAYAGNGSNVFSVGNLGATAKLVDTTGGSTTIRLPSTHQAGWVQWIKDVGGAAGTNPITIDTADADLIDGQNSIQIATNYGSVGIVSDGTNYFTI